MKSLTMDFNGRLCEKRCAEVLRRVSVAVETLSSDLLSLTDQIRPHQILDNEHY